MFLFNIRLNSVVLRAFFVLIKTQLLYFYSFLLLLMIIWYIQNHTHVTFISSACMYVIINVRCKTFTGYLARPPTSLHTYPTKTLNLFFFLSDNTKTINPPRLFTQQYVIMSYTCYILLVYALHNDDFHKSYTVVSFWNTAGTLHFTHTICIYI